MGDFDLNDGQGNCPATRLNAATALARYLATDPTRSLDHDFLIIGDLNANARESAVTALVNAGGYVDLIASVRFVGSTRYSYVFHGWSARIH